MRSVPRGLVASWDAMTCAARRLIGRSLLGAFVLLSLLHTSVSVAQRGEPTYDESDTGLVRGQLSRLHVDAAVVAGYDLDAMHRARLELRAIDDGEWRGHTLGIGATTAGAMGLVLALVVVPTVEGGCTPSRCPDAPLAVSIAGAPIGALGLLLAGCAIAEILSSHARLARWVDSILDGTFRDGVSW